MNALISGFLHFIIRELTAISLHEYETMKYHGQKATASLAQPLIKVEDTDCERSGCSLSTCVQTSFS